MVIGEPDRVMVDVLDVIDNILIVAIRDNVLSLTMDLLKSLKGSRYGDVRVSGQEYAHDRKLGSHQMHVHRHQPV